MMKKIHPLIFTLLLVSGITFLLPAQTESIDRAFREQTIKRLNELMIERYVFPEVAQKTADHLIRKQEEGYFDAFDKLDEFAEALTREVQSVNRDKHMRIRPVPPYNAPDNSPERMIEEQLDRIASSRRNSAGFREVKKLDGNIARIIHRNE